MAKQYYCLVAGLEELILESPHKGFDATALRREIEHELSVSDLRALRLFCSFYDVENVLAVFAGKTAHNPLGNYSSEALVRALENVEAELGENEDELPGWMAVTISAWKHRDETKTGKENGALEDLERSLWGAFYRETEASSCRFVREWYAFDQTLRNIAAAYIARAKKWPVGEQLVGESDLIRALTQSSAADFGLRGEVEYIDSIVALLEIKNILEKEQRLDQIRWARAGELTLFDYFNIHTLLAYLAKVHIIHRWSVLDRSQGEQMLRCLLDELSDKEILRRAEQLS